MSIEIETPAWQSLGEGRSVLVDLGLPPSTRTELRDRCAAVAELHGLRWERVQYTIAQDRQDDALCFTFRVRPA